MRHAAASASSTSRVARDSARAGGSLRAVPVRISSHVRIHADISGRIPFRVRERVAAFAGPLIHQRKPIAHVLRMCGNRRALIDGAGRVNGGDFVERSQQADVARIENECAAAGGGAIDELRKETR